MKYTMRYYRRHSIQIPACPACPFFKPSTTTQGASQSRRRASKDSTITTTPTKTSSSIAVDYSEWDAAMNSLLEEEGKQQSIQPPLASSPRRVPSNNRRNDMMMRKSTRTSATSFTTASTNTLNEHSSSIAVNRVVQQEEADIYIYTINDSDESSISSMEDSICSSKKEEDKDVVDWERLERYIEQEDDIEDCFAYALDMGVLIQQSRSSSSDDDDDCYYNSNSCQGDLLDGKKQTTGKKRPQKFASDGIVGGGRLEQMRVRCPAA